MTCNRCWRVYSASMTRPLMKIANAEYSACGQSLTKPAKKIMRILNIILMVPTVRPVRLRKTMPRISRPPVEMLLRNANPVPNPLTTAPKIPQTIGSFVNGVKTPSTRIIIVEKMTAKNVNKVNRCPMAFHANTNNGTFRKNNNVPVENKSVVASEKNGNAILKLNHLRTIVAKS